MIGAIRKYRDPRSRSPVTFFFIRTHKATPAVARKYMWDEENICGYMWDGVNGMRHDEIRSCIRPACLVYTYAMRHAHGHRSPKSARRKLIKYQSATRDSCCHPALSLSLSDLRDLRGKAKKKRPAAASSLNAKSAYLP